MKAAHGSSDDRQTTHDSVMAPPTSSDGNFVISGFAAAAARRVLILAHARRTAYNFRPSASADRDIAACDDEIRREDGDTVKTTRPCLTSSTHTVPYKIMKVQ